MKVLLLGGTGFVGRNLTQELLENGYQVYKDKGLILDLT